MRILEIQNEVDQFHVVISILSQFERMNVQTILEWMERYSIIFDRHYGNASLILTVVLKGR